MEFDNIQRDAMNRMKTGSILVGGTGSGKSRTSLAYYYVKELNGRMVYNNDNTVDIIILDKINKPLYIITTAAKRDKHEWEKEMIPFCLKEATIDSWNNIAKYTDVEGAFFIFDEQRVVGSGTWSKSFLKIAKKNNWILLSATPGDTWQDYIPVFIANGFYKNRTQFYNRHAVWSRYTPYPKIEKYVEQDRLEYLRSQILIEMPVRKRTIPKIIFRVVDYNKDNVNKVIKDRWNIYEDCPIENAPQYMSVLRKTINSDPSRKQAIKEIIKSHNKVIIFYSFDYERDIILDLAKEIKITIAEWNGHKHEQIPETDSWIYLVQYTAGSEGWECIKTDTIIFYSLSYSYRITKQAEGRIDRRNTKFIDLYYYFLISNSHLDQEIKKTLNNKKEFNYLDYYNNFAKK